MGAFDPSTFLDATLTEANSTTQTPCPEGEYEAVISDEPVFRQFQGTKDPSKSYMALDLNWEITDPAVCEVTGRTPTKVRQSLMLDVTDAGGLDMGKGKNVGLGRLREAVGLNEPGKAFSFRQLQGQRAKVRVTHRAAQDAIYDEVRTVARIA